MPTVFKSELLSLKEFYSDYVAYLNFTQSFSTVVGINKDTLYLYLSKVEVI